MKKTSLLILAAGALLTLASCNSVSPTSSKPADSSATASSAQTSSVTPVASSSESSAIPTITSVTVTAAGGATSVYTSQTLQLTAAVVGTNNPATTVTWSSSANSVATVNASGLVTGVAAGEVTITATSTVDATKSGSITLSVAEKIDKVSDIKAVATDYAIKAVVVGKDSQDVALSDGTGIIYAYFKGSSKATNKIADFAIGDYYKITGQVGNYYGVFQLYAENGTDSDQKSIPAFTATKLSGTGPTIDKTPVEFTSAMIDAHKASTSDWGNAAIKFVKYQSILTIEPVPNKTYNAYKTVVGSYDTHLHSLDTTAFPNLVNGAKYDIVGLDFGWNSGSNYQNIMVTSLTKVDVPLTGLTISGEDTVVSGKTITLSCVGAPEGADGSCTWSSATPSVATVDSATGVVTGVAAGTSVITATSTVTPTITATKTITGTAESVAVALPINTDLKAFFPDTYTFIPSTDGKATAPAFYAASNGGGLKLYQNGVGFVSPKFVATAAAGVSAKLTFTYVGKPYAPSGTTLTYDASAVFLTINGYKADGKTLVAKQEVLASDLPDFTGSAALTNQSIAVTKTIPGADIQVVSVVLTHFLVNSAKQQVNMGLGQFDLTTPA
jgi:uncharacterized protein YjdB